MELDSRFWLPDAQLAKVDIGSMASSVEARSPMLDHELFEFAASLGVDHKLGEGRNKLVLRDVARHFLPDSVVDRPKQELAIPLERWLLGAFRDEVMGVVASPQALERGHFEPDRILQFARTAGPEHAYPLWTLYMLERWHRWNDESDTTSIEPRALARGGPLVTSP